MFEKFLMMAGALLVVGVLAMVLAAGASRIMPILIVCFVIFVIYHVARGLS